MKARTIHLKILLLAMLAATMVLVGCQDDADADLREGNVSFAVPQTSPSSGRTNESRAPSAVLISIEDHSGKVIRENVKLDLVAFGQGFVTSSVALPVGQYKLSTFIVLDNENVALYAAPRQGSPKASLVENPLPLAFSVDEGSSTTVKPQVLAVSDDDAPAAFGYAAFTFDVVEPDALLVQVKVEITVGKIVYRNVDTKIFVTGFDAAGEEKWSHAFDYVGPGANVLRLKSGFDRYSFEVSQFGAYDRQLIHADHLEEAASGEVPVTFVLGSSVQARRLISQTRFSRNGAEAEIMESKIAYQYNAHGLLEKIIHYGVENGTLAEQRYFNLSYEGNRLNKMEGFWTGNPSPYIHVAYRYDANGKVVEMIEGNAGTGITTTATFAHLYTDRLIQATYRLSNGTGFEYQFEADHGSIASDITTRWGQTCSTGSYYNDKQINPLAHLGYMDMLFRNYSLNNRLTEDVDYIACSFPSLEPKVYSYEYTTDGYPTNVITHYKGTPFTSIVRYSYE